MLTSIIRNRSGLEKFIEILNKPDQIKKLIDQLLEQEEKTKAVLNDLTKAKSIKNYHDDHVKLLTDLEDKVNKSKDKLTKDTEHLENKKAQIDSYQSTISKELADRKRQLDLRIEKVKQDELSVKLRLESVEQCENELVTKIQQAEEVKAEYEQRLNDLKSKVASLK